MSVRFDPETLSGKPLRAGLLFLLLSVVLYIPAWKAGFQQDFQGWLLMYYDNSLPDILDRKGAGVRSLYQLTQLQLYFWTAVFGTRQWLWAILFISLHATNGSLMFRLSTRILDDFKVKNAALLGILGTVLFLIHPGMSEVVVWKACYHYHIAMLLCLLILGWSRSYLRTGQSRYAWYATLLLLLGTTTLELWWVFPWMALALAIVYRRSAVIDGARFAAFLTRIFLPMLLIFGLYLLAYHARYGIWMAHGAYENTGGSEIARQTGRIWSYESHIWLGARLWPGKARNLIYAFASNGWGWLFALILLPALACWLWSRMRRAGSMAGPFGIFVAWAVLGLATVLHFAPDELFLISNDRYLYFTGAFQCVAVVLLLARIFRKARVFNAVVALVLVAALANTVYYVICWRRAGKVFYGIQYNYKWDNAPVTLLLNIPCIYRGIGIIHANPNEELGEHMRTIYKHKPASKIVDVAAYNMEDIFNGAHVIAIDSTHLKVTLNQWGTWWWFNGRGLLEYENEYYRVRPQSDGLSYDLELKKRVPGMVILFSQGDQWREVDMSTRAEQW
jgi:hypothetical protein